VGKENKIKKLGWKMEKECPWKGNECKGKKEFDGKNRCATKEKKTLSF
jgi:hypothetical protein